MVCVHHIVKKKNV